MEPTEAEKRERRRFFLYATIFGMIAYFYGIEWALKIMAATALLIWLAQQD